MIEGFPSLVSRWPSPVNNGPVVRDDVDVAAEGLLVSGLLEISWPDLYSSWVTVGSLSHCLGDAIIPFCLNTTTYEHENLLDCRAAKELVHDLTA